MDLFSLVLTAVTAQATHVAVNEDEIEQPTVCQEDPSMANIYCVVA